MICVFVAESCNLDLDFGEKGKSGILKSMDTRAELHDIILTDKRINKDEQMYRNQATI